MKETLKQRIYQYFMKHHTEWISSGEIQRLVMEHTSHTPSNASRRLRELENEQKLEVSYRLGHAYYKIKQ